MGSRFHAGAGLPPEITHLIIDYLAVPSQYDTDYAYDSDTNDDSTSATLQESARLAPYASISSIWQRLIEARTFRSIVLTPERLFSAYYVLTKHRFPFLQYVALRFIVPDVQPFECNHPDLTKQETSFANTIKSLFRLLAQFSPMSTAPIGLKFDIQSPRMMPPEDCEEAHIECDHRYFLNLDLKPHVLPELPMVTGFVVDRSEDDCTPGFDFSAAAICTIASRMPRLDRIVWTLADLGYDRDDMREENRDGFARTLEMIPPTVEQFLLKFYYYIPAGDFDPELSMLRQGADRDPLTLAMRRFSARRGLAHFLLDGSFDQHLLCPVLRTEPPDPRPFWPSLRSYSFTLGDKRRCEEYFIKQSASARERRRQKQPDSPELGEFDSLLMQAAGCALDMPILQSMDLRSTGARFLYLAESGEIYTYDDPTVRPREVVLRTWLETVRQRHGDGAVLQVHTRPKLPWMPSEFDGDNFTVS